MASMGKAKECPRCKGVGRIRRWDHVDNGVCYLCQGKRVVPTRMARTKPEQERPRPDEVTSTASKVRESKASGALEDRVRRRIEFGKHVGDNVEPILRRLRNESKRTHDAVLRLVYEGRFNEAQTALGEWMKFDGRDS